MKCDEFEARIHRSLDRRGTPWSQEALRRHAHTCSRCAALLAAYEDLLDGVQFLELATPGEDFAQSVVADVTATARRQRRRRALAAAAAAVAATVLLVVGLRGIEWRAGPSRAAPPRLPVASTSSGVPVVARPSTARQRTDTHSAPRLGGELDQVYAIWSKWRNQWQGDHWQPIDRLEGGLAPITTPLSIAIDEIRSAIPLGSSSPATRDAGDSAGVPSPNGVDLV
jgi:hypothetical protein